MKGYRILIVSFITVCVAGIVFCGYILAYKRDQTTFGNQLLAYTDATQDKWKDLTVKYKGRTYHMANADESAEVCYVIQMGGSTRKKMIFPKEYATDKIEVEIKDKADITVMRIPKKIMEDGVIMKYHDLEAKKTKYYTIKKVKFFEHLLDSFDPITKK